MGCVTEITTVHEVGWRIRLLLPEIKWSVANAKALKNALLRVDGVYHIHACVHTSTVVVYYNPRKLAREQLFEAVHHCEFPESEEDKPKVAPPVVMKPKRSSKLSRLSLNRYWLAFDLVKHGVLAGSGKGLPLALVAMMALSLLNGSGHHRREKPDEFTKKSAPSR
jgi:hypothetical protein